MLSDPRLLLLLLQLLLFDPRCCVDLHGSTRVADRLLSDPLEDCGTLHGVVVLVLVLVEISTAALEMSSRDVRA